MLVSFRADPASGAALWHALVCGFRRLHALLRDCVKAAIPNTCIWSAFLLQTYHWASMFSFQKKMISTAFYREHSTSPNYLTYDNSFFNKVRERGAVVRISVDHLISKVCILSCAIQICICTLCVCMLACAHVCTWGAPLMFLIVFYCPSH